MSKRFTVTHIARVLNLRPNEVNEILVELEFQVLWDKRSKVEGTYQRFFPTAKGEGYCSRETIPDPKNPLKTRAWLVWSQDVIDAIGKHVMDPRTEIRKLIARQAELESLVQLLGQRVGELEGGSAKSIKDDFEERLSVVESILGVDAVEVSHGP
jgi:hypothetical protein